MELILGGDFVDKKPNRLINEKSPYLLQHAYNPVDWHPWGDEAFEKAKREDKPVFLSIGYSTCHWCHVSKGYIFVYANLITVAYCITYNKWCRILFVFENKRKVDMKEYYWSYSDNMPKYNTRIPFE